MDQRLPDPAGAAPPDWRALCSRMADELDHYRQLLTDDHREVHPLAAEARAVLARYGHQPAPPAEGADCPACEGVPKPGNQPCAVCGRSASSAGGEVAELAWWLRSLEDASVWFESGSPEALKLTRAADLLERLASPACVVLKPSPELIEAFQDALPGRIEPLLEQRHPAPVPVSERKPGPDDCDAEGRVWVSYKPPEQKATIFWELAPADEAMEWAPVDSWLPANALPLPQWEVQP